jgi:hypothetical protein
MFSIALRRIFPLPFPLHFYSSKLRYYSSALSVTYLKISAFFRWVSVTSAAGRHIAPFRQLVRYYRIIGAQMEGPALETIALSQGLCIFRVFEFPIDGMRLNMGYLWFTKDCNNV